MTRKRTMSCVLGLVTGVALLLVMAVGVASGKGKPKPPPSESGVIYFSTPGPDLYSMDPDGNNQTLVLSDSRIWGCVEPSELLHGGERWFLATTPIAGESYPDGRPRYELSALSESGTEFQLTDDPTFQFHTFDFENDGCENSPRWSVADTRVSFVGRRFDTAGAIVESGIYYVDLDVDVSQGPSAVVPVRLTVDTGTVLGDYGPQPDVVGIDWSPDGTAIAFGAFGTSPGLHVAEPAMSSAPTYLYASLAAVYPRWSPDGSTILFVDHGTQSTSDDDALVSIASDGQSVSTLVEGTARNSIREWSFWSPSGTSVLYMILKMNPRKPLTGQTQSIYRAAADGSSQTVLTNNLDWAYPLGWRE